MEDQKEGGQPARDLGASSACDGDGGVGSVRGRSIRGPDANAPTRPSFVKTSTTSCAPIISTPAAHALASPSTASSDSASAAVGRPRKGCFKVEYVEAKRELRAELAACQKELLC
eukprot:324160-Pleurochrysis_carterae.AAC.1